MQVHILGLKQFLILLQKYNFLSFYLLNPRKNQMKAKVSIIMGSTSDLPVMEKAAKVLNDFKIPFEINALSAHRTPEQVEKFAKNAKENGIQAIIAGAGMAAHLPGVIAAMTSIPVIGVPIKASLDGMDALLSIAQMPPGIPVATVGINGAMNAGILAAQILAVGDENLQEAVIEFKEGLKEKIVKANEELSTVKYDYKTN
ncbi:5-(carboxyamino)imidazole ribonucleotide mutase [Marinifilum flexuosum]|uniref:N5-carboxyaminoimidazole ribonucleotide mutase n=2 Tax=Marinifilum flexuosum TaxID=1117708 RepID=A0A419X7E0_9BACT|nr:5-(carboxyamino)imidazole ribonucleotide mutase [Marinifilum flexuosum]RKE03576.1 5-(carboxyamino)imidazole ribonucleotide mutase [Marinifilum flexuosum]